ncbi:TPA: type VI secretion system tip protein VgrG [Burkholderia cepacia ATCC 25416]|uniref:type VI secretion system Vgr family protein n=1 Tax=Burkholderia cepacia TaxID=292 RepID=UPI001CF51280|nr:type VI secretion system tip protein VgrG [Burkholderia cepacia]HDR9764650.1 type VI secretion system tip protein VgrG [Burkholderia cepacia ATCC 25416]MCA8081735.1 type VI secretion system tip protein VgrG [Burkholderia cepacia]HDR9777332.1 type VI secretion system tip protein VgrG [Burkholderia cepacia ATCC 25416]HDR9780204.1 type VI secretion system tip protein VgrG [Burkholderia cepacia ATCC 25416]HDR9789096.1 type VI secretion system tip protein VgrG [Burkholderia cepacia ATCC 25416]
MNRVFTLDSPHGDDLKFHTLDGSDELGRLFEFRIEALADSHSLSLKDMLGKPVTVRIEQQDLSTRYLNGIVARASLAGRRAERYYGYELIVRPWLWLATRRSDCRIFQNKTVPEIVQEVLSTYGFPIESHLAETYVPRDYCVQYNETDAAFVSRLMEFEGIYYWFRHAEDTHTLMLSDAMSSHTALPGYETIPYIARDRTAIADEEHIDGWLPAQEVSVGKHQTTDYDYTKPRADLSSQKVDPRGHDHDSFASFEWPGGYRDDAPGAHYSRVRLEEQQAEHERASADTDVRGAAPGYLFTLEHCPRADQNREYLIVRCQYRFQENAYASDQGAEAVVHQTMMLVQPSSLPYRSPRDTPRPRTNGPQTATVVGPPGEEIWTDQYGRVKLQFRWDRYGQSNQDSSCWVRVSSPWAGGGFGGVQIPRVGDEVVVDFLNGDPDEPIVTGRVYNGEKMPPWGLPGSATQSGLLSRSSPGGTTEHANAFRFEDKKGAEQLWMHAERNFDAETELDHSLSVGNNHTHTVGNDETMQVKNNRQRSVGQNETVNIGQNRVAQIGANETHGVVGNRTRTVGQNETVTIAANRDATIGGVHTETVAKGKTETIGEAKTLNVGQMYQTTSQDMKTLVASAHTEEIGTRTSTIAKAHTHTVGGEHTVNVGANHTTNVQHQVLVNAGDQLALVCGMSSIVMKSDGTITIQGVNVASTGTNTHSVNGKTVTSSATAEHTVEGAVLKLNP